jgi:3-methylcrotonyl-CoA carboxylase alpha subunit
MDGATREAITEAAVKAARAVDYVGAGTIEFIADGSDGLRADRIWFMEMNTRLQVEHPVTEAITGQDLVEWQLRVAAGEKLPLRQDQLRIDGWAMEARLYAENPATGFLPSTGKLDRLRFPPAIRVDSGVEEGGEVSPFYDPMVAKLIVHGQTRGEAAAKLASAARQTQVWPIRTNAAFLARAASHPDFVAARIDTGFIARHLGALVAGADPTAAVQQAAAAAMLPAAPDGPWTALSGFRVNAQACRWIEVEIAGKPYLVERSDSGPARGHVADVGFERVLFLDGEAWPFGPPRAEHAAGGAVGDGAILSPMPGQVIAVAVQAGAAVTKGQRLVVLEAMKMEMALVAPFDGTVAELKAREGTQVAEGTLLIRIEKAP